eukprot:TRINITY_DN32552_c0_g1_i4.p1 TRINITY_DN32552_c0_g1~~TRINITY_DN32552_c0_g1_i4.p1  ORF type:complete len:135 (-),score=13.92 TRINITY_DN32552_c0_g1_i4:249-653(-)
MRSTHSPSEQDTGCVLKTEVFCFVFFKHFSLLIVLDLWYTYSPRYCWYISFVVHFTGQISTPVLHNTCVWLAVILSTEQQACIHAKIKTHTHKLNINHIQKKTPSRTSTLNGILNLKTATAPNVNPVRPEGRQD